jgi:hypothetical protein
MSLRLYLERATMLNERLEEISSRGERELR